jgi:hypothetical protein
MSDFPEMEYQSGDAEPFELAPGETSLSFLQKIYRSPSRPIARRMRAAMAALQHEHPKLTAMGVGSMNGEPFAALLDKAIERSGRMREVEQIELKAEEVEIVPRQPLERNG